MSTFLRFDSVGGASGDMILSALVALGADLAAIETTINAFFPETIRLASEPASGSGLHGLRVTVRLRGDHAPHTHPTEEWPDALPHGAHTHTHGHGHTHGHHTHTHGHGHTHGHTPVTDGPEAQVGHPPHPAHRGLHEIDGLLLAAPLPERARTLARATFRRLAEAEAKIHNKLPESVHFHEVGAWDSVADVVGACLALEQLGVEGVACGPLPSGVGTLRCAHGEMPNPAPATLELLAGMCVIQTDEAAELVTPTGAALLRTWTLDTPQPPAAGRPVRSAYGFGTRTLAGRPNVLRVTLYTSACPTETESDGLDRLEVLEANLDDCNPEWLGALTAELLERGALDVWQTPALMKKGRPGTLLGVLARPSEAAALRAHIFRATTTFGVRTHTVRREALDRQTVSTPTPWGEVAVKVGSRKGVPLTASPEHESCAALARRHGLTTREVYEAARAAYFSSTVSSR